MRRATVSVAQRAPNTPKFAQHHLSGSTRNHTDQIHPNFHPHSGAMTSHTGTSTPKFIPLVGG